MEAAVTSGVHAGKTVANETVDIVIDYIVPVGFGLVGLGIGPTLFGGLAIQNNLSTVVGQNGGSGTISNNTCIRIGGGILSAITLLIGYAFWRLGKHSGWAMRFMGRAVGAFFLGTGLNYLFNGVIMAKNAPSGLIDSFVNWGAGIASGG